MTTLDNAFKEKVAQNFLCKICNYNTSRKSNYVKHCSTSKHINLKKNNEMTTKNNAPEKNEDFFISDGNEFEDLKMSKNHGKTKKVAKVAKVAKSSNEHDYQCQNCNKIFNDRAGMWRHKKKCIDKNFEKEEIIQFLINENKEMKQMMVEQNKQFMDIAKSVSQNSIINNTTHNNSHNKTFNLQVFLNETCKDAMNIMDFVNSMEIDLDDLEKVGELGYVDGMTNIILKNLKALDITKRPLHCTDAKRETLYIKDKDKWERETENKDKMKLALKYIIHKNAKMFNVFKAKYPDCIKSYSNRCDQYNKLVVEVLGGKGDNETQNNEKIIRRIAREVTIDRKI
jgi:hypothetical protein